MLCYVHSSSVAPLLSSVVFHSCNSGSIVFSLFRSDLNVFIWVPLCVVVVMWTLLCFSDYIAFI